ncbi:phage tail protein [Vibrio vulnificus]|nr:phage tail protein [Vibrio vulnificus]
MSLTLTITKQGLAECISAKERGLKADIKWISAGDRDYTPSHTQNALRNERQRVEISQYVDTGLNSLQCLAKFSGPDEYAIKELAIWLSTGTLFGVISEPGETLNYKAKDGHVIVPFTLDLSVLPTDSVQVIVGTENLNILIDTEMMSDAVAFVRSQSTQTQQLFSYMKLSEKVAKLETLNV